MELGRLKDQLDRIEEKMVTLDPESDEWEVLRKRDDLIRRTIADEEKRLATEERKLIKQERELELKERDLEERKADRATRTVTVVLAILLGVVSTFRDEAHVITDAGFKTVEKVKRIVM